MSRRIRSHIGMLWLYSRRCLLYNLVLSLLGSAALFSISLAVNATPDTSLAVLAIRAFRVAVFFCAILVMSLGHGLALFAMRLFHWRETPYYRNAGLGAGLLAAGAWVVAIPAGAAILVGGLVWI